jgi:pre-mRNA cleavage complex 2 protein Pcf11
MASGLPSDEVAEDFKDALQDLKINSKPEIDVLTVIAKENTEHAQAISRVLENHIKTVREVYIALAYLVHNLTVT